MRYLIRWTMYRLWREDMSCNERMDGSTQMLKLRYIAPVAFLHSVHCYIATLSNVSYINILLRNVTYFLLNTSHIQAIARSRCNRCHQSAFHIESHLSPFLAGNSFLTIFSWKLLEIMTVESPMVCCGAQLRARWFPLTILYEVIFEMTE